MYHSGGLRVVVKHSGESIDRQSANAFGALIWVVQSNTDAAVQCPCQCRKYRGYDWPSELSLRDCGRLKPAILSNLIDPTSL